MGWLSWLKRSKRASAVARYAAEVLYAGWIPSLVPVRVRAAVPARTHREIADEKAFLGRVYKNQRC